MAKPTLTPASSTPTNILPSASLAATAFTFSYPFGIYASGGPLESQYFASGAIDQVAFTYKRLGGDVLDIELTEGNVFAAYEEAVLEYSYIINLHQAKNALSNVLGSATASFDHNGNPVAGGAQNLQAELKYPKFKLTYPVRVARSLATYAGTNGDVRYYSASLTPVDDVQDYDLQSIISSSFPGVIDDNQRATITDVWYKTPFSMWRFFAYYGALNVIGNLSTYGQYSDDSTFEVVPTWQNKAQAMAYEDSIYTRVSHYSFELIDNRLRLFPKPQQGGMPDKFWFRFYVDGGAYDEDPTRKDGMEGVNNMNTLPFNNIAYTSINAIGKQWIRRYALAIAKEMLGQIRGKFGGSVPIPGDTVSLNSGDLLGQASAEKEALKTELNSILDQLTYVELAKKDAELVKNNDEIFAKVPMPIFQG
jgi:hypothetical protein|tara:strand:- start:7406 stop:8668 length:1263 start_codon:yes stop_codon:yes gene_type:complete